MIKKAPLKFRYNCPILRFRWFVWHFLNFFNVKLKLKKIDAMVYALYGLSDNEIGIVEK